MTVTCSYLKRKGKLKETDLVKRNKKFNTLKTEDNHASFCSQYHTCFPSNPYQIVKTDSFIPILKESEI